MSIINFEGVSSTIIETVKIFQRRRYHNIEERDFLLKQNEEYYKLKEKSIQSKIIDECIKSNKKRIKFLNQEISLIKKKKK